MKKLILTSALLLGLTYVGAQSYSHSKEKNLKKEEIVITVSENRKNEIDWNAFKEYFSDKKENDSIQFAVRFFDSQNPEIKIEKKYSVKGIKKNIDDLINILQKSVK